MLSLINERVQADDVHLSVALAPLLLHILFKWITNNGSYYTEKGRKTTKTRSGVEPRDLLRPVASKDRVGSNGERVMGRRYAKLTPSRRQRIALPAFTAGSATERLATRLFKNRSSSQFGRATLSGPLATRSAIQHRAWIRARTFKTTAQLSHERRVCMV